MKVTQALYKLFILGCLFAFAFLVLELYTKHRTELKIGYVMNATMPALLDIHAKMVEINTKNAEIGDIVVRLLGTLMELAFFIIGITILYLTVTVAGATELPLICCELLAREYAGVRLFPFFSY